MTDTNEPGAGWAPPSLPSAVQKPTLPPAVSPSRTPPSNPGLGGVDPTAPMMQVVPGVAAPSAPKRSRAKTVGALAGVGALVAAGAFAVVTITGNDEKGGAASPTEVGTLLTAALDNEDVLGVIDLLLPGEREAFRDPIIDTFDNLRRLGVLADDASLSAIGGVDIKLTDVVVRDTTTNAPEIVNLELSGSATVSVDGEKVPLGGLLIDDVFEGERPDMDADPQTEEFEDVPLTVVQRDGRWYLSAFYTVAEQARADTDLDIPATGVAPKGADAPEGALDDMLEAVSDQNLERLIGLLDPTEAEALQRYAPLFLDDAQAELDDAGIHVSISDTAFSVSGSGSRRFVLVDAITIEATDGNSTFALAFADGCATVSFDGDEKKMCTSDLSDLDQLLDDAGLTDAKELKDLITTLQRALDDYEPRGVAVHEVDGEWYVSPIQTYAVTINDVLAAFDRDELSDVIADIRAVIDNGLGLDYEGGLPDIGDLPLDTPPFDTAPGDTTSGDTVPTDSSAPDEFAALEACYSETEAAAGITCMQEGVADGTIDPIYVSPAVLHPECGVAELYWTSDYYSLADAEFAAMAEGASKCFLDLVATGEVDSFLVPGELIAPDCLEGKNWYATDDSAYDDRFFECVSKRRTELGI
mgnify:CR=1 FL=1